MIRLRPRPAILAFALSLGMLVGPRFAHAQIAEPRERGTPGNLDVRVNDRSKLGSVGGKTPGQFRAAAEAQARVVGKAADALRARVPGAEARISPVTGAVEVVRASRTLTAAAPGQAGFDIVRGFLADQRALFGLAGADLAQLHFIGESVSPGSGLRMVRVEQTVNGRPVFQSETRVTLDREGRVIRSVGLLVPNASRTAPALAGLLPASAALASAMASVGIAADAAAMTLAKTDPDGMKTEVVAHQAEITRQVPSEVVYFPLAPGVLVPAWSQVTFTSGSGDWYTLVDARTGALLWRKNIRAHLSSEEARFSVYVQADGQTPADSPAPLSPTTATPGANMQPPAIARTTVSMLSVQHPVASPDGWIPDGGTTTTGNNVDAYLDRTGGANNNLPDIDPASSLDGNGRPLGNPDTFLRNRDFLGATARNFNYTPPPLAGDPEAGQTATGSGASGTTAVDAFRRGAVTNLFYVANWYHDRLHTLGFDEAAGNFQEDNFGRGGTGGDRVLAEVQDNSGTNNANFSTPPDGTSGRMQMFRFTGPTIDRDGDLDAEIVIHELTHGLTNRLIGNGAGLNWAIGGGMGEGWSDFYALSLLNPTNADDPNGRYAAGAYATYKLIPGFTDNYLYGIRRFPYCTDNSINPLTWGDVDQTTNDLSGGIASSPVNFNFGGALEVHNIGEVWALTLWEVRSRIIADPQGANGEVPSGNNTMLRLVTDALKMTPINPSFLDARDALLDADAATNNGANEESIWSGFADRGLGYNARAPLAYEFGYTSGHMGVAESFSVPYLDFESTTVDDSLGNHNGVIDPGEPIKLTVKLKNPWRTAAKDVASATAALTTSTPGVTILDGSATYPAIPAQGSANGDTFLFLVPIDATAGQALKFTITPTSSLGSQAVDFVLRVGAANGNGTPITYTRTIPGGLAIPDNTPSGVSDAFAIPDDLEIADLDFRVDDLQHTFTGDLTVMLRAPNGYGTDLISAIGGLTDGGPGDNLINTVIDDQATGDFLTATGAAAPFTGSWLPVFNVASWTTAGFGTPDPVGELGRLNGTSTQGVWKVVVSDQFSVDTGTLNAWSLIVTPKAFTVTPFAPTVAATASQTVSGNFVPGGTVTYHLTLTNNGTGIQPDNAGDEFSEMLPPQLTLVSATATSGTAAAAIGNNTVTWNGSILPLGESITITITATLNAGTAGQTVAAQGTLAFDADLNGSNELSALTDDPSVGGAADPTRLVVLKVTVTGTQTVAGLFAPGGTVTYTAVLTNSGTGTQGDNPGSEFTEVLPGKLTLMGATASSGTAVAMLATNSVSWNGSLSPLGSVTITITARLALELGGQTVSAQGQIHSDADLNGSNELTSLTDDPAVIGIANPTTFAIGRFEDLAFVVGLKAIDIDALGNDSLLGGTLTITGATNGQHGTVTINPDGTLHYVPTGKLPPGGDAFFYTASDGAGGSYTILATVRDFAEASATFTGLAAAAAGMLPSHESAGLVRLTSGKKGTFTGALLLAGTRFPLRGHFDAAGVARFGRTAAPKVVLQRKTAPDLVLSFQLAPSADLGKLAGTLVEHSAPFAAIDADRAGYTARRNPVAPLLNVPAEVLGKYTVIFPAKLAPNQGLDASHFPQGDGIGRLTVRTNGIARLAGKLADGTPVVFANALSKTNAWPLYVALYRGKGSITGRSMFRDTATVSDLDGLELDWFRPANARAAHYQDGWPGGIRTDLLGSKFLSPPAGVAASVLPGLLPTTPAGNADLEFRKGGLPLPGQIDIAVNVDARNKATLIAPPAGLMPRLVIAPSGLIGGSFIHPADGKRTIPRGVIFQKQERASGYFLGPTESGAFSLVPK